jgi:hypothetical protein
MCVFQQHNSKSMPLTQDEWNDAVRSADGGRQYQQYPEPSLVDIWTKTLIPAMAMPYVGSAIPALGSAALNLAGATGLATGTYLPVAVGAGAAYAGLKAAQGLYRGGKWLLGYDNASLKQGDKTVSTLQRVHPSDVTRAEMIAVNMDTLPVTVARAQPRGNGRYAVQLQSGEVVDDVLLTSNPRLLSGLMAQGAPVYIGQMQDTNGMIHRMAYVPAVHMGASGTIQGFRASTTDMKKKQQPKGKRVLVCAELIMKQAKAKTRGRRFA